MKLYQYFRGNNILILFYSKSQYNIRLPAGGQLDQKMKFKNSQNHRIQQQPHLYFPNIQSHARKYQCCLCQRELTQYTSILSNSLYYCVPCVAKMKKFPSSYHVINKLEFPIFSQNWTATEQIMLFQGLEKHGFGNWAEIAEYLGTEKTKAEVEKHYTQIYLNSPNFIPVHKITIQEGSKFLLKKSNSAKVFKNSKSSHQILTSKRILKKENEKKSAKASEVEIVGYMPLRRDFQYEYDNQAELLLAEMEFLEEDTVEETEMKFKIIALYNQRLTKRNQRKDFVINRGLLDLEKQTYLDKTRTKEQKQFYNMMKIFARLQTSNDHEELVQGLLRQKELKQKIKQLKELRDRGLKTNEEVQIQMQRKHEAKSKKKSNCNQYSSSYDHRHRRVGNSDLSLLKKNSCYFTPEDLNFCRMQKISGVSFMLMKQTLLRQQAKQNVLNREQIAQWFRVDRHVVNKLIDYLVLQELIACHPQTAQSPIHQINYNSE